jgi:hypothetical protein
MTYEEREGKGEAAEFARMRQRHRATSPTGADAMTDLLLDLARAKAVFQLRAIEAALGISARSKPDQETPPRAASASNRDAT